MAVGALAILLGATLPAGARADVFSVTQSVWGTPATPNTLAWAIDQANASTATGNVISIASGLQINVDAAASTGLFELARITRSVTIEGHQATLVGNPTFVTSGGQTVTKLVPQELLANDILAVPSFSFVNVGVRGVDNTGVVVTIRDLNADGLNRFARVETNARLDVAGGTIANSVNFTTQSSHIPGFEVTTGATLNVDQLVATRAFSLTTGDLPAGFFSGLDATINVSRTTVADSATGGVLVLAGGTANVVSSILAGSGGVFVTGGDVVSGTAAIVNSAIFLAGPINGGMDGTLVTNRILSGSGAVVNITASTVVADMVSLDESPATAANGVPLDANGGTIHLAAAAVMATIDDDGFPTQVAYRAAGSGLSADAASWVRPTTMQSAADLRALFSQQLLRTGTGGLPVTTLLASPLIEAALPFPAAVMPLAGGPLIGAVADADTTNLLLNPIDGSPILFDVFGNPRTSGGLRNAGAVQGVPEIDPTSAATVVALVAAAWAWSDRRRRA